MLVAAKPGHKDVQLDGETRLELARAAFPDNDVELDPHERTVDTLQGGPVARSALPDRRRRVLRFPDLEGS